MKGCMTILRKILPIHDPLYNVAISTLCNKEYVEEWIEMKSETNLVYSK